MTSPSKTKRIHPSSGRKYPRARGRASHSRFGANQVRLFGALLDSIAKLLRVTDGLQGRFDLVQNNWIIDGGRHLVFIAIRNRHHRASQDLARSRLG